MASNPATSDDVQSRFPRALTASEQAMATTLLDDAWFDLLDAVPTLDARLDEPEDGLPEKAVRVLAQSVKRVLLNPFGRKQESRGIDDAQRSWTVDDALRSGDLYFTDAELNSLQPAGVVASRGKAFSIQPWFDACESSSESSESSS